MTDATSFPDVPAGYDAWHPIGNGVYQPVKYPHAAVYDANTIPLKDIHIKTLAALVDELGWESESSKADFIGALKKWNPHTINKAGKIVGAVHIPVYNTDTNVYE